MVLFFKGLKHQHIFVCDIEYDNSKVIQFAGLLFKNIDMKNSLYQIESSINVYIQQEEIGSYATRYTGIDKTLLDQYGKSEEDFLHLYTSMFANADMDDTLFVSHGSKNDRKILKNITPITLPKHSFCTYRNAKRILDREGHLTLTQVAAEAGYFLDNAHDAFADAWATVAALSFLLKLDGEEGE
jgi:DNA polymerase III epsilon subunit-like protein